MNTYHVLKVRVVLEKMHFMCIKYRLHIIKSICWIIILNCY